MFLNTLAFRPYQDLDGKAAAEYLVKKGYTGVAYADIGTNGLAVGLDNAGELVSLSTNGYFCHVSHYSKSYQQFLESNPKMLEA